MIVLASSSQSRHQLLREAGFSFEVAPPLLKDELLDPELDHAQAIEALALHKMQSFDQRALVQNNSPEIWVIGADTLVETSKGELLGKPKSQEHARELITLVSKEPVKVITGYALGHWKKENAEWKCAATLSGSVTTKLWFSVPAAEIESYFANLPQALHACGAGIIEGYGFRYLEQMEGDYTSVIGLPIAKISQALYKLGYQQPS